MRRAGWAFAAAVAVWIAGGCDTVRDVADTVTSMPQAGARKAAAMFGETSRPGWPAELSAVALGEPPEAWREALPEFDAQGVMRSALFADTEYRWHLDDESGRVARVVVHFGSGESPLAELEQAWGPAVQVPDAREAVARHFWFSDAEGLRAELRPGAAEGRWSLEIGEYWPAERLIGREAGAMAFERGAPVLGATAEALRQQWPQNYHVPAGEQPSTGSLRLPPSELNAAWTRVDPHFDGQGRVDRYTLTLDTTPERRAALVALLRTKYGEPLPGVEPDGGEAQVFLAPQQVVRVRAVARDAPVGVRLVVERYLPLEQLWVPGVRGRFVFERERPWIGQLTRAEFDSTLADRSDDGGGASVHDDGWMSLPPIEYDDAPVPVFPRFDEWGRVTSFRLGLGYGLVPSGRDAILAEFERVLGAPVVTGQGESQKFAFAGPPAIVLEDSPQSKEWLVRVGDE